MQCCGPSGGLWGDRCWLRRPATCDPWGAGPLPTFYVQQSHYADLLSRPFTAEDLCPPRGVAWGHLPSQGRPMSSHGSISTLTPLRRPNAGSVQGAAASQARTAWERRRSARHTRSQKRQESRVTSSLPRARAALGSLGGVSNEPATAVLAS